MTQLHFKIIEQDTIAMALLTKIYSPLNCLLISLWVVFSSVNANASTISIADSGNNDAKLVVAESSDMLIPSIPNSDGNSYTKLTSFTVDRPLKIINSTGTHGSLKSAPAKLIIIDATSADLRNSIEIVGETADLLIFVNSNTARLSCINCSFANIGRATLATVAPSFDSLLNPQNLIPVNALLSVNGLSTDRVASTEFIGRHVELNGLINTQTRGTRLSDGSYQLNPNGGLVVGAGGVNIFSGFNIFYPTLRVGARELSSSLSIPGSARIASQAVHISTARPFKMLGTITTKSDVATAVNYRGSLSAVEESIKIYSFDSQGALVIDGPMISDNLIDVRSSSDLIFNRNIQAAGLIGIAGDKNKLTHNALGVMTLSGGAAKWKVSRAGNADIVNVAECSKDQPSDTTQALVCLSAFISAGSIDNNGTIKGRNVLMASVNELQNRYGGKIFADNIQLSSQLSFIRNGSKYPFKPAADQPLIFAPIDPNNIPLGAVTIDGAPFLEAQNGASKVDTTALIIGKNITLVASGNIENINPYVELMTRPEDWLNGVTFSPVKSARVQILADNNLKIGSSTYLLNASAYLGVANPEGSFYVSSPFVANQRYSTQAAIQPYSRTVNSVVTTGTEAALMVYSPPGVIYSFSPLVVDLGTGGNLINNTSYFEILNNAKIISANKNGLTNIGLNVNSVVNTSINNQFVACISRIDTSGSGQAAGLRIYAAQQECNRLYGGTTVAPGSVVEAQQGTLFHVRGKFDAGLSELKVTNHDVMAEMKNQVISDYILAHSGVKAKTGSGTMGVPSPSNGGNVNYNYLVKFGLSADGTSFISEYVITSADFSYCYGDKSACESAAAIGKTATVEAESVAQVLIRIFNEMKVALINAINKLLSLLS